MSPLHSVLRKRYTYRGIIQGVGFRPAVYRCAVAAEVGGFVQNRRSVVVAEAEGTADAIELFEQLFDRSVPAAARIDSVETGYVEAQHETEFSIRASEASEYLFPPIPPDLALCDACRRELLDPENRRYLYPFITCTQCGPRYSIVADTPFDRTNTSMAEFTQCPDCLREYTGPEDRRFHSQTNSCRVCGPRLFAVPGGGAGDGVSDEDSLVRTVRALADGKVAAVQGIGGFHLAADPASAAAVEKLRLEKEREKKPFALMVRDLAEARRLCFLGTKDEELLTSPKHPIVILEARSGGPEYLSRVSDNGSLGIMLPYTPMHVLLFFHPALPAPYRHLIMTSGNRGNEPIITDPAAACTDLVDAADLFLYHNREILLYSDDSIVRSGVGAGEASGGTDVCILRRSRGFVPEVLRLPEPVEAPVLAVGGDLKNSAAYADANMVYLSPYAGDLEHPRALQGFEQSVERIMELYKIRPERVVCDMHPGYMSRAWALEQEVPEIIEVQHHHAHALSVMAEHGLEEAVGVSFDGTGYGTDGTIWGGEILYAERGAFRRLAAFRPFRLPGGEAALYSPGRIAFSLLHKHRKHPFRTDDTEEQLLAEMIGKGINSPYTSSAGRLFDAAAYLLGLLQKTGYEGEGPMKMEWAALREARRRGYRYSGGEQLLPAVELRSPQECGMLPEDWEVPQLVLDWEPLFLELAEITSGRRNEAARLQPVQVEALALQFHRRLAEAVCKAAHAAAREIGVSAVCLGGGVFQNMLLRHLLRPMLESRGLAVYTNVQVSPGDGGLALGQAYFCRQRVK